MTEEKLEALMVLVVDGMASPQQQVELSNHINKYPELAQELETHMSIKKQTDDWIKRLDVDLVEDTMRKNTRVEQRLGLFLLFSGIGILFGFGMAEFMLSPDVPLWLQVGYALLWGGGLLLLISAIRHRLSTRKKDHYIEVTR